MSLEIPKQLFLFRSGGGEETRSKLDSPRDTRDERAPDVPNRYFGKDISYEFDENFDFCVVPDKKHSLSLFDLAGLIHNDRYFLGKIWMILKSDKDLEEDELAIEKYGRGIGHYSCYPREKVDACLYRAELYNYCKKNAVFLIRFSKNDKLTPKERAEALKKSSILEKKLKMMNIHESTVDLETEREKLCSKIDDLLKTPEKKLLSGDYDAEF